MCGPAPRGEEECGTDSLLHHHDSRGPATATYMADCTMEGTVCVRVCVCVRAHLEMIIYINVSIL